MSSIDSHGSTTAATYYAKVSHIESRPIWINGTYRGVDSPNPHLFNGPPWMWCNQHYSSLAICTWHTSSYSPWCTNSNILFKTALSDRIIPNPALKCVMEKEQNKFAESKVVLFLVSKQVTGHTKDVVPYTSSVNKVYILMVLEQDRESSIYWKFILHLT